MADGNRIDKTGQASVSYEKPQSILVKASGFLDAYDYTLNQYAGCSFGCTYCYAASFAKTDALRDSWGKWVVVKENAVDRLRAFLRRRTLDGESVYMSSVTDPYQPIERKLMLTRRLLEVFADPVGAMMLGDSGWSSHKPKLVVQTRSPLVTRDVDLFRRIEDNGGRVQVNMTVTTDDDEMRRVFEPYCPSNDVRLNAIAEVKSAGVEACVTMTPLLLVSDAGRFVDNLLATGVRKFIVQPFHFRDSRFVASTRDEALRLMSVKLGMREDSLLNPYGWALWEIEPVYMRRFNAAMRVFADKLPNLGYGKDGFKPPF